MLSLLLLNIYIVDYHLLLEIQFIALYPALKTQLIDMDIYVSILFPAPLLLSTSPPHYLPPARAAKRKGKKKKKKMNNSGKCWLPAGNLLH